MRKILSSSNALMIAVLVMLAGIALWAVFASEADPVATDQTEEPADRPSPTALGGGPTDESVTPDPSVSPDDEAPVNLDTPQLEESREDRPDLEQPAVGASEMAQPPQDLPQLDKPQLERRRNGRIETDEARRENTEQSRRPWEPNANQQDDVSESDEMDQEAAFRSDEAPEANVIGVQPADVDTREDEQTETREGGGPIDERDDLEPEAEGVPEGSEERVDGAADEPAGVEGESDTAREADQETGGDADDEVPSDDQFIEDLEVQYPADDPAADESTIERPGLRSAPRPSRPGEDAE